MFGFWLRQNISRYLKECLKAIAKISNVEDNLNYNTVVLPKDKHIILVIELTQIKDKKDQLQQFKEMLSETRILTDT